MRFTFISDKNYENKVISKIKLKNGGLIGNFYENHEWFQNAVANQKLLCCETENAVLILYETGGFFKLFFFASSAEALGEILQKAEYPDNVVICEFIDKNNFYKDICNVFMEKGYLYYGSLINISKVIKHDETHHVNSDINVCYAVKNDYKRLMALQHAMFNPYLDKHISETEMLNMIENRQILVSKHSYNDITGFIIFNVKNMRSQLKYWAVDKQKSLKGTGSSLLGSLCERLNDGSRLDAWCREDNQKALNIYENKNFTRTGLICNLFYYDGKGSGIEPLIPLN